VPALAKRGIGRSEAISHVFGYTIVNDVTAGLSNSTIANGRSKPDGRSALAPIPVPTSAQAMI
jgi:2-keto-4-pentenoate hydratase/2-oxohepta-3-ene-1,7-dioic acid hydratase in catechol pathway